MTTKPLPPIRFCEAPPHFIVSGQQRLCVANGPLLRYGARPGLGAAAGKNLLLSLMYRQPVPSHQSVTHVFVRSCSVPREIPPPDPPRRPLDISPWTEYRRSAN